jgi:diguanylate cyclase (GGDEF)-like protein
VLEVALPAAVLVVLATAIAIWTRMKASARIVAAVRDLSTGLGFQEELAASLDPDEVTERVLAAAAALPGADAALLIVDGQPEAIGLTAQEAERAALQTPANTNLRSMEVVYRYRLDEVAKAPLGGAHLSGRADSPRIRLRRKPPTLEGEPRFESSNLPRAALVVPLRAGDRTIGSLSAITRSAPHSFPEETVDALEAVAQRAGPALANANRFVEAIRLAELDSLTGLHNQRVFHDLLGREVARSRRYGRRLSLVVLDLDDFKRINDRIGHLAGDTVLAEVAARMRNVVRSTDIACRVGGDEFAVIMPESTRGDADHLAARIERAVGSEPIAKSGTLKISAGVAELSSEDTSSDLFNRADEDLYRAKAAAKRAGRAG